VNQQEATKAGTFSGLRAESNVKETISYGDFSKHTLYDEKRKFDECVASGGSADTFMRAR
jgi:hypothetical protein